MLRVCNPPLGLLYLASSLLEEGYQVKIIDASALNLTDSQICQEAFNYSPQLIGIPILSETSYQVYNLINELKKVCPHVRFVLGGQGVNAQPQKVLEEFQDVDFALQGECEETIVDFCGALENKGAFDIVRGLCYRKNGDIICNDSIPSVTSLNDLKLPAKELLQKVYLG